MNKKPWGFEMVYADQDQYSGSVLIIKEGERTPYIYHKRRDKIFFVLQGTVSLTMEGNSTILKEGEHVHIAPKIMHRLHAIKGDVTIIEAGTKIEDDVVVVESDYEKTR